jgi:fatty acid desaturase
MLLYKPYRVFYRFLLKRLLVKYNDDAEKTGETASFILKPLFDCPPCMASVWGIPFALLHPLSIWTLVYLFALSGFNYIVMKIISK